MDTEKLKHESPPYCRIALVMRLPSVEPALMAVVCRRRCRELMIRIR
jgi:hypothetical protein